MTTVRRLIPIVAALALVAGTGAALALAGGTKQAAAGNYSSCIKNARTTAAAEACIATELKRVNGVMNAAYRKLLATSGVDKAKLTAAQAKWVSFRDADCSFSGSINAGGSLEPIDVGTCKVDLTTTRASELQTFQKQIHP